MWLVTTADTYVDQWGTDITTPSVNEQSATVDIKTNIRNTKNGKKAITLTTIVYDREGKEAARTTTTDILLKDSLTAVAQHIDIQTPKLWSLTDPYLYNVVSRVMSNDSIEDEYTTPVGIRSFEFNVDKGFLLNGQRVTINGGV